MKVVEKPKRQKRKREKEAAVAAAAKKCKFVTRTAPSGNGAGSDGTGVLVKAWFYSKELCLAFQMPLELALEIIKTVCACLFPPLSLG